MDDDGKLPRFSSDLIDMLDESIPTPRLPVTVDGWSSMDGPSVRRMAFKAGARWMVDMLIDLRAELEAEEADGGAEGSVSDGPPLRFPRLFGSDGEVREVSPPVHMDDG